MGLLNREFFQRYIFIFLLLFVWAVATIFILIQYSREREIRAEMLDNQLQIINAELLRNYPTITPNRDDIRISVIDLSGNLVFDSQTNIPHTNHISRPEISKAIQNGKGFTIDRRSESNNVEYFYSATRGDSVIIRTAVPYNVSLSHLLQADSLFFIFMAIVTLLLSGLALFQHKIAIFEQQEKVRIKKQLTNNINHELKTPVNAIQVCLETILSHPDMEVAKQREFIERCYNNAERLRRLLVDIGTITRLDDGAKLIDKEVVNLVEILDEVIDDEKLRSESAQFDFAVSTPKVVQINGNVSLLHSLFRNLIDNAIAYSEGNKIEIKITTNDKLCSIIFADNGKGVQPHHLPHLFERFYRVDKGRSRRSGGTGLGLSIVKNSILFHGGTILVSNRASGGLQFNITLPIV